MLFIKIFILSEQNYKQRIGELSMLIQLVVKANDLESINSTKWDKEGQKNKKNEEMMRPCLTFFQLIGAVRTQ